MARRVTTQALIGALIVLIGVVLLLSTTDVYDARGLLLYVPSLFVLVGLYALVTSGFRNLVGPLLVVVVAAAWQLVALDVLEPEEIWQFWPVLVILFGLSVFLGPMRARVRGVTDDHVSGFAVFGGSEKRVTGENFAGADLTALFGGVELDLRDATVRDPPAHVAATALFGGVEVIVPRDWNVQIDVLPVLGAAEDERPRREGEHESVDLVVTGFAAFGGVSVSD
jgi:hypothetical protein